MLHADWMRRTKRGLLTPRSRLLENVDKAFKALEDRPSRGTAEGLVLALDAWKKSKSDWQTTTRNNDSAVDDLTRWAELKVKFWTGGASPILAAQSATARMKLQDDALASTAQEVHQTIQGDPQFGDQDFSWTVKMDLIQRGTVVEAVVRILGTEEDGTTLDSSVRKAWDTHIKSAWNIATVVTGTGPKKRHYDLQFHIDWVEAGFTGPCYRVGAVRPPPDPAAKALYIQSQTSGAVSEQHRVQLSRQAHTNWSGGSAWGFRANMLSWAATDRQAIIHEFGHVIGNPDEYLCSKIRGFGHTFDNKTYNNPPFSTDSIMNNTGSSGRIHERHFRFVQMAYRRWKSGSGADVKILRNIGPDAQTETRQLLEASLAGRRRAMGYDDDD
jgi:hypothetical protein